VVGAVHGLLRLRGPGYELRLAAPPLCPERRSGRQSELLLKNQTNLRLSHVLGDNDYNPE
jgi:hypothetical protein